MNDNQFFKQTPLHKEFMILALIEENSHITQRMISEVLGVALSMVNSYIEEYETNKFITRKYRSSRTVEYFITKKGLERKKLLNLWYLKSSHKIYMSAKDNIISSLNQIIEKDFKSILLYGAGEVAEILLNAIYSDDNLPYKVLAIVDDDINKQGGYLIRTNIISLEEIKEIKHDGILITNFGNSGEIYRNLDRISYDRSKILSFFRI